jgi:(1->4)-alpha-D-glucan 1-alpha-D-glucosylmutase
MLRELEGGMEVEEIMQRMDSGLPKLWLAHNALCLRREHPDWFGADAQYSPITADGPKSDHLVGYLRGDRVAVFVPRWPIKLGDKWTTTSIEMPPGEWKNVFTRETFSEGRLRVQNLLQRFPVALLAREVA